MEEEAMAAKIEVSLHHEFGVIATTGHERVALFWSCYETRLPGARA
jgi:hypothetical protein